MIESIKKFVFNYSFWLNASFVCAAIYLLIIITWLILVALIAGIDINSYAANGTFQLYNPLRRLDAGQVIGHDFPFFHGIGVPLIHYPIYQALGSGVFAAETAKWIITPFLYLSSSYIFFYAYFRNHKKPDSNIITNTFIVIRHEFFPAR